MHLTFVFTRTAASAVLPEVTPGVTFPRQRLSRAALTRRPAAIWSDLHRRALTHEGDDSTWIADYTKRIIGTCQCRKQWDQDIAKLPPDFSRYFEWTVAIHNAVNARIGKPILTVEEARARWTQDIPAVPAKVGA